ncbi:MAG: sigma 54-interacting transcriptional regulator [Candidatus Obscuribacterales bacterium]|jgi:two-component system NtrC family response regulator
MTILLLQEKNSKSGALCELFEKLEHKVEVINSLNQAISTLKNGAFEIVFIAQEGKSAIQSLTAIKQDSDIATVPVVMLCSIDDDNVIEAMRLGAIDHLVKPSMTQLKSVIERTLATSKQNNNSQPHDDLLLGQSPAMRQVQKLIGLAASCDATVIILGETGTGKDKVAREIHKHSIHSGTPLTVVDCTAVPENYQSFRALNEDAGAKGTVILDEIGDLNKQTQAMLVRALKETKAVRIIATSQYNLAEMVKEKSFREDLYYRLNVLPIQLPPLNKRGSDILALAELFLQQALPHAPKQLSRDAAKTLLDCDWPGNVRELQNLMYHLSFTIRSEVIGSDDLQIDSKNTTTNNNNNNLDYYSTMADVEKRLLADALESANGSRTEAARLLGINRQLLYSKLKAHGLMKS